MSKDLLPNREVLKRIVVEVGDNNGRTQTRRVIDNSRHNVNIVRRPGEGSRPLFDRNEIINGGPVRQDQRFSNSSQPTNSDSGDRLMTDDRRDYRSGISGRTSSERSKDDSFSTPRRQFCPMCQSELTECGGCYGRRRIYRTLSDDVLFPGHPYGYHNWMPIDGTPLMEPLYGYEDPTYYALMGGSLLQSPYGYAYYPF